ncbi:MAG: hypothetical protein Q9191_004552 [Dirinaria sp. TL-2023a]
MACNDPPKMNLNCRVGTEPPTSTFLDLLSVVPLLLYSVMELMSEPRPRWKPSSQALFDIRFRGGDILLPCHDPPYEPAVVGLLTLHLAVWRMVSLTEPSMVHANMIVSFGVAFGIFMVLWWMQPKKRVILARNSAYGWGPLAILLLGSLHTYVFFKPSSTALEQLHSFAEILLGRWSLISSNLPWFLQVPVGITVLVGLYLAFRTTDPPLPVYGMLRADGKMCITSTRDGAGHVDSVTDLIEPEMSESDRDYIRENITEFSEAKPLGYYGPRQHDSTRAGLTLIVIGLTTALSADVPLGFNQALRASVPVYMILGLVANSVGTMERNTTKSIRSKIRLVGLMGLVYGCVLWRQL